jgi:hypothetical protein
LKYFDIKDSESSPDLNIFIMNYVDDQVSFITPCIQISPDILIYNDKKCSILNLIDTKVKIPVHRASKIIESANVYRHIEYLTVCGNIIQLDNVISVNFGYREPYKFTSIVDGKQLEMVDSAILQVARRKVILNNLHIRFGEILSRKNNLARIAEIQDQILMLQKRII